MAGQARKEGQGKEHIGKALGGDGGRCTEV